MKDFFPYILAIVAGIFTTLETSLNSQLGELVNPKIATLHSLLVGSLVMLVASILSGNLNEYYKVLNIRFLLLIGGIFGALIIYFTTKAIPKIGITTTLTIVIAAQILSSLYFDIFILKQQKLDINKILGALLVLSGVYLISE